MRGKALLIIPYFGSFGPWLPLYLHSLANQTTLDLLLLTDTAPPALPPQVRRVEMTFDQLRERAAARLSTEVSLHRNRNICDLRPAYGLIFEEFVRGYEYWGFGDEDVLYGDVDGMLGPHLDGTVDIVSPGMNGKSGHLTLVRNAPRTNELAMRDPAFKEVLASREHWAYDETSWRHGPESSSFYALVKAAAARGELTMHQGLARRVNVPAPGRWYVHDGRHLREDGGTELLYYHWGRMRHLNVRWPDAEDARRGFAFDRYGFYDPQLGPARLAVRRSVGRVRELASQARRRLSEARSSVRAATPSS
ncbi:MAG TPA: DUF6625 family protein [Vicinamibacterales bacterium]|nr:DUF6625 family protein [Vicinamibacterales bacterium]